MKNKPVKKTHTLVLSVAILLTTFSIIGSVAMADLFPLVNDIDSIVENKGVQSSLENNPSRNEQNDAITHPNEFKKIEFNAHSFQSAVKPNLWSCFNCGVITAIESIPEDTEDLVTMSNEDGLLNYLEAHRENARIIALDETKVNPDSSLRQSADQYITYLIKVRMQDGTQHVIKQDTPPEHEVGDKIRLNVGKVITA